MAHDQFSRRHFFYGTLLAGAVPAGGFGSTPSLKQLGYKSPNEKLNIAAVGAGGRATEDIRGCATENIVALCDVDGKTPLRCSSSLTKAAKYKDFRRMLDKEGSNIDAVIVAIPDHMHATVAMWAMERGKSVYVEKPLTRTVWEARMLTQAAAKYKVATQMGNQGYSNEGARLAAEIIWSGEIGNVTEVHAWTNRPIWPQGISQIPPADTPPPTLDWDLWLGGAKPRPYASGGAEYSQVRRVLPAVQLARLLRLRLRRAGRHGVPHLGRAEHGAHAGRSLQRRGHQAGGKERSHFPEVIGDPLRVPGAPVDARGEALLVRRHERRRRCGRQVSRRTKC